jgi:hypothetical protein
MVGDGVGSADGADDTVGAFEQLLGELVAEAGADAGDEPGPGGHVSSGRAGATSLIAAGAFRVRG